MSDKIERNWYVIRAIGGKEKKVKEDIEALVIEFESNRKLGFIPSDETLLAQLREWEQQRC